MAEEELRHDVVAYFFCSIVNGVKNGIKTYLQMA